MSRTCTGALRVGPQSAGRGTGPGLLRPRRHRADRDRRQCRARAPAAAAARRRDGAGRRRGPRGGRQTSPTALGLDVHGRGRGIVDIVNESMLGALRVVTVQKGLRPDASSRSSSFGGAGRLHANALAALLGCFPVLVPPEPGVLSALGLRRGRDQERVQPDLHPRRRGVDADEVRARLAELGAAGRRLARGRGRRAAERARRLRRRHALPAARASRSRSTSPPRSSATLEVARARPSASTPCTTGSTGSLSTAAPSWSRCASSRAAACRSPTTMPSTSRRRPTPSPRSDGTQHVWAGGRPQTCRTTTAPSSRAGMRIQGYAIVEQYDATTVVLPGHAATVDHLAEPADRARRPDEPMTAIDPDHARPDRERAAERALRDGRGRAPRRHVADDPRAARRVPDDLQRSAAR